MFGHAGVSFGIAAINEMADDLPPLAAQAVRKSGNAVMCALCGVLGAPEHSTDAVARPGVFTRNADRRRAVVSGCIASLRRTGFSAIIA